MKKMATNESKKYFVDYTVSKYLGESIEFDNMLSNSAKLKKHKDSKDCQTKSKNCIND